MCNAEKGQQGISVVIAEDIYISPIRAVPLYKQIAHYFRKKLIDGAFYHGDTFPSSREIAKATGVHYNMKSEPRSAVSSFLASL